MVQNKAGIGASEQNKMKAVASGAWSDAMFNGVIKTITAAFSFMNAKELGKLANDLEDLENRPDPDLGSDGSGDIGGQAPQVREIGNAGSNPAQPNPDDFQDEELPLLGDPIDFDDEGDTVAGGPTPGAFDGALAPQDNSAGELPGLSGAATEAASTDGSEEAATAQYAGLGGSGLDYLSGGGGVFRGGRGGRGPANTNGPNLTDLLAKFLPNMKKDGDKDKRGILSFGRRSLASAARSSLLGPEANIFETIARTYRAKTRAGAFKANPRRTKQKKKK